MAGLAGHKFPIISGSPRRLAAAPGEAQSAHSLVCSSVSRAFFAFFSSLFSVAAFWALREVLDFTLGVGAFFSFFSVRPALSSEWLQPVPEGPAQPVL